MAEYADGPFKVGKYTLTTYMEITTLDKTPKPKVWIQHESGEAMACDETVIATLIDKFYKENF